jgi:subtilisin family serine protease
MLLTQQPAQAAGFQSTSAENQYASDEIIVKFKPYVTLSERSQTAQSFGAKSIQTLSNKSDLSVAKLPAGQTVTQALSVYANDPNVEYAQPNYIYHATAVPNDPDYGQLWAAKNNGQSITGTYPTGLPAPVTGTAGDDMNLEAAWNVQTDCSSVIVAVVDSGVNYNSTDLAANMWNGGSAAPRYGWNFVGTGSNDPMDYAGHGTHVAGIIGAVGNNSTGTTGVCWKASIMAVRVLDATGSGFTTNIIQGIDFAINNGAKIINMSLGGGAADPLLSAAITRAQSANVLVVVAAGNKASNNDTTPSYPCSFAQANLLCVAALDQNYALATFSNWGASSVDVGAPGTNIRSTWAGSNMTITDSLTAAAGGWNFSSNTLAGGWGFSTTSKGINLIANPNPALNTFWGVKLYNAGTDDRMYKTFNLSSMAGADVVTLAVAAAINVNNLDYIKVNFNALGGDPFQSGTPVFSETNLKTIGSAISTELDITGCLSATCSVGAQLTSTATSTKDIGVAIGYLGIQSLKLNTTSFNTISGTSMATPEVAGVAALVWAHNPQFTYSDVANAIKQGGRTIPALAGKITTGRAVDAMGALSYIAPPTGITVNVQ